MPSLCVRCILLAACLALGACASSTPTGESTGEFFDNSMITAKIKSRLIDDPMTGIFRIKVNTFKGVVQLSGIVHSDDEKSRAEVIAYSVDGVKKVENSLEVTPTR
ncbi:MAG: BON domain-containing protein [Gammaproteobacteria bacterium]|nr:BON domain-containing protein [Gammaproteobacteria bacterium]